MKHLLAGSLTATALAFCVTSTVQADILGLTNTGQIYSIQTSGGGAGTAAMFFNFGDPLNSSESEPDVSPNSLAYSGGPSVVSNKLFATNFNPPDTGAVTTVNLYQGAGDGAPSVFKEGLTTNNLDKSVASGDVSHDGGTYYYIDRAAGLYNVNLSTKDISEKIDLGYGSGSLGDLALTADDSQFFVSYNNSEEEGGGTKIGQFEIDGTVLGTYQAARLYAGLAFDGGQLFGITTAGSLYSLSISGTNIVENSAWTINVDGVALAPGEWTDAARVVPIPAAAWLFGSALVGMAGVGYRRRSSEA